MLYWSMFVYIHRNVIQICSVYFQSWEKYVIAPNRRIGSRALINCPATWSRKEGACSIDDHTIFGTPYPTLSITHTLVCYELSEKKCLLVEYRLLYVLKFCLYSSEVSVHNIRKWDTTSYFMPQFMSCREPLL